MRPIPYVEPSQQCVAKLRNSDPWSRYEQTCSRRGTEEVDGKLYCKQHSPKTVAAKEAAQIAERDRRREERDAADARLRAVAKRLGVQASGHRVWSAKYDDPFTGIVLDFRDAERIADALGVAGVVQETEPAQENTK